MQQTSLFTRRVVFRCTHCMKVLGSGSYCVMFACPLSKGFIQLLLFCPTVQRLADKINCKRPEQTCGNVWLCCPGMDKQHCDVFNCLFGLGLAGLRRVLWGGGPRSGSVHMDAHPAQPRAAVLLRRGRRFSSAEPRRWRCCAPGPRDEAKRPLSSPPSLGPSFPGFNERRVAPPRLSSAPSYLLHVVGLLFSQGERERQKNNLQESVIPVFQPPGAAEGSGLRGGNVLLQQPRVLFFCQCKCTCSHEPVACLPTSDPGGAFVRIGLCGSVQPVWVLA